ncbi:unnamed protein product [Didymodactylos carnosus]|uniref:Ankyrin repeat protein n=1 Tax=Didymodactylos carnosus TaxID=1234261 RepID=A0A8S2ETU6_9BILA|nr:unnamed protein product [Didymodactylos carnosus]CAF4065386.1 unnamed protein product [Didymodactylos carnosus]
MSTGKDYVPQLKTLIDKHDVETFERLYKTVIHELDIYEQNELLFRTCRLGPVEIFQILFEMKESKDLNNVLHPTTKSTLLHYAIKYGQHKIIDYLLSSKSSCFNVKNVFGETCLSVAIDLQNLDVVKHLLHHISAESIDEDLITHAVCHYINEIRITTTLAAHKAFAAVQVLVAHSSNNLSDQVISKAVHKLVKRLSWLYSTTLSDDQWLYLNEIMRYFVEKLKCSLSYKDKNNRTLMMLACRASSVSLVAYLLEKGLHYSVNDQDSNGETCLFYAVERNDNTDMIDLLIDKCHALVELRNGQNLTALHKAIRLNSFQNVKHLLTKWDDVQKYFSYACQYSSIDITQLFLQHQHQLQTIEKEKALDCALKNENKNDSLRILGVLTNSVTNLEKSSYGVHK